MPFTSATNSILLSNNLTINQDTSVYSYYNSENSGYDYILEYNIRSFINDNPDITTLFTTATYQQSNDINNVNINLIINPNIINSHINASVVTIQPGDTRNTSGFSLQRESLGDRLVEIVAHKIFGHAQARAAINNDTEFYQYDDNIWSHLCTTLANNDFAHNLFNQYVSLDRITNENDDINYPVNFNFNGLSLDFPLYLTGSLVLDNSLSPSELLELRNGPNLSGGTALVNGRYNVPILVKFKSTA